MKIGETVKAKEIPYSAEDGDLIAKTKTAHIVKIVLIGFRLTGLRHYKKVQNNGLLRISVPGPTPKRINGSIFTSFFLCPIFWCARSLEDLTIFFQSKLSS